MKMPLTDPPSTERAKTPLFQTALSVATNLLLLYLAAVMLWSGTFFHWFYASGVPPWAHTTLAFVALLIGGTGLARQTAKVPWRRILARYFSRIAAIAVFLVFSGYAWHRFRPLPEVPGATRAAVVYLDNALWHLERYYLRRDQVDWSTVRRVAFIRAAGAKTPEDTFPAIVVALAAIGDHHNILLRRDWRRRQLSATSRGTGSDGGPWGRLTSDRLAYVSVPSFIGSGMGSLYFLTDTKAKSYADALRQTLISLDQHDPVGWVVDLRRNPGGNMWPMLDGLAALIGEGSVAAIDMPQLGRRVETWVVKGRASSGAPWFAGLPWEQTVRLRHGSAPVVVLIGRYTASSGEAIAVAFRGRPRTRLIGAPTAGVPTALQGVSLGAGAELMITIGRQVDRTGRAYDGPITPDEFVPGTSEDATALLAAATRWIRAQAPRTFGNAPPN